MRAAVAVAVACFSLVTITSGKDAEAAIRRPTNISAQELAPALKTLATERNVQLVYRSDLVDEHRTTGAAGDLTLEEALAQLLSGTGLTYRYLDNNAVTIVPIPAGSARGRSPSISPRREGRAGAADTSSSVQSDASNKSFWDRFRLARTETTSQSASADSSASSNVQLEEIVVSAQKRGDERLKDVPMSIVALSARNLEERHITSIDDLGKVVPGLQMQVGSVGQRRIMIRGITNVFGTAPSVGVYIDEASVTSNPFAQLDINTYDLERIEVLRGPQGTLYGEGSIGGAIRFITAQPKFDGYDFRIDTAVAYNKDGEPSERVQAVVNIPVSETFALRAVGSYEHGGGWIDQPAAGKEDYNDKSIPELRVKALWQPSAAFSATAMAVIHRAEAPISNGEDASGNFTQSFNLTATPSSEDDYDLFNLTASYAFNGLRFLSTTSYVEQDKVLKNYGRFNQATPPPAPRGQLYIPVRFDPSSVFTQEFRLNSDAPGALAWTLGAFYRDSSFTFDTPRQYSLGSAPLGTPLPPPASPFYSENQSEAWAAFADLSYKVREGITLGAGIRYFEDSRFFDNGTQQQRGNFDALSPRVYATFALSPEATVYASIAKGFRSGGFNSFGRPPYDGETVLTYETGVKFFEASKVIELDTSVFYSDYTDYQVTGIVPPPAPLLSSIVTNAGDALVRGIESSLVLRPSADWMLGLNGSLIDSKILSIATLSSPIAVGDRLDMFPKYNFSTFVQRDFQVARGTGFARLEYTQTGKTTYRNRTVGPFYYSESDVINLLNLTLNFDLSERASMGLFAQNLLDDRGYTDAFSVEGHAARLRPLTVGIEFGWRMN